MKLNITIDLEDLYDYCDQSVGKCIKEIVAEEIGKAVRKAVRDGMSPELSRKLTDVATIAHKRSIEAAIQQITGK